MVRRAACRSVWSGSVGVPAPVGPAHSGGPSPCQAAGGGAAGSLAHAVHPPTPQTAGSQHLTPCLGVGAGLCARVQRGAGAAAARRGGGQPSGAGRGAPPLLRLAHARQAAPAPEPHPGVQPVRPPEQVGRRRCGWPACARSGAAEGTAARGCWVHAWGCQPRFGRAAARWEDRLFPGMPRPRASPPACTARRKEAARSRFLGDVLQAGHAVYLESDAALARSSGSSGSRSRWQQQQQQGRSRTRGGTWSGSSGSGPSSNSGSGSSSSSASQWQPGAPSSPGSPPAAPPPPLGGAARRASQRRAQRR